MRISYHSHYGGLDLSQGYGTAGFGIIQALKALGHETPFNDPSADILLNFTQPPYYQFHRKDQFNIGYTPWESNDVDPNWIDFMMKVDELWTTSPQTAKWFKEAGVDRDIKVYEHGIDHKWQPKYRLRHGPLKFLHIGADMTRKGGQEVFEAFIEAFGVNNPDVRLTFKTHSPYVMARKSAGAGNLLNPMRYSNNIQHIHGNIELQHLINIFYMNDALVYPSFGEGFGLIPLQALATGMPVIMNTEWASYSRFVDKKLTVRSNLIDSPWPLEHPGQVWQPNVDDIVQGMLHLAEHYDTARNRAFALAPKVHEEYDWVYLTRNAFAPVIARLTSGE